MGWPRACQRNGQADDVADAMADYLRFLENHRKSAASARNRVENDILPQLGHFQN